MGKDHVCHFTVFVRSGTRASTVGGNSVIVEFDTMRCPQCHATDDHVTGYVMIDV